MNTRGDNFDFSKMGIQPGEKITLNEDPSKEVFIADNRKVEFENEVYSLTALTTKLLGKKPANPCPHWKFQGHSFSELPLDNNWSPSLEEYHPGITKEQWLKLLRDEQIMNQKMYIAFARIMDNGGEFICSEMSVKYGDSMALYRNFIATDFPALAMKKFGVKPWQNSQSKDEVINYSVFSQIKRTEKYEKGSFKFRLRTELQEALEDFEIQKYFSYGKYNISCIIANISWNSNGWRGPSDDSSGFRYVQEGNTPGEIWNFDFDNKRNIKDKIFGYAQFNKTPKAWESGTHLIFFSSDSKVVGVYGKAYIQKEAIQMEDGSRFNICGLRDYCTYFDNPIDNSEKKYLEGGERIGMVGFNYLYSKENILSLLHQALFLNPQKKEQIENLIQWVSENEIIQEKEKVFWITPCNPNQFRVREAFKKLTRLNWKQENKYSVGDIVFLYVSGNENRITYKTKVTKINVSDNERIEDSEFIIDDSNYKSGPKMELELIEYSDAKELQFDQLKEKGLKSNIQSPVILKQPLLEYIESFFDKSGDIKMGNEKINEYVELLKENHNIILHGAPGTGKTHLAKEIAKTMNAEVAFCQFHPSYDYTDFVEGLRPNKENGFERIDGIFKKFCSKAILNKNEDKALEIYQRYLKTIQSYKEINGIGISRDEERKLVVVSSKSSFMTYSFPFNTMKKYFFDSTYTNGYSTDFGLIVKKDIEKELGIDFEELFNDKKEKDYIFIIDEINRGELSKIFGELFFSIDPGYRGIEGKVNTQYQNLVEEDDVFVDGFYIPDNVYIIGTMNDIDRSVESMDFAMRRRFVFEEVTAKDSADNMGITGTVRTRMDKMNDVISKMPELGKAYCIGGSYFLKEIEENGIKKKIPVEENDLDKLWKLKIGPLVYEYLRGIDEYSEECSDGVKYQKIKDAFDGKELN